MDSRADETADISMIRSELSTDSPREVGPEPEPEARLPSGTESFIVRRWNRDADFGPGGTMLLNVKQQQLFSNFTPAFWVFWVGFLFPPLWLIGGWHFTRYGEQPPRLTFWEFYFNTKFWKDVAQGRTRCVCCGQGKVVVRRVSWFEKQDGGLGPNDIPVTITQMPPTPPMPALATESNQSPVVNRLPHWISARQSSHDANARLNDPKRSLRGISFGYPFVPPSPGRRSKMIGANGEKQESSSCLSALGKPNRLLDLLYGVKLTEIAGRPESPRRIIDPWIQRCRYAFCWALIFICIASCITSVYLVVYNTRQLR
jgi:hypothetical protein